MRIKLKFFSLLICYLFLNLANAEQLNTRVEEEINISVYGMRCVGCEFGVERELKKLKGVVSVKADSSKNIVTIRYKKNLIKIDEIIDKINELGYRAEKPYKQ